MSSGYRIGQYSPRGKKWKNGIHFRSFDYGSQRDPENQRWEKNVPGPFVHNPFPQVMEKKEQSALTFSPQIEELERGDRRIHALVVIEHHLKLFLLVVIGLDCVYTSQPSDSSWHSECEMAIWRHGFHSFHTVPLLTLSFLQLTLGALAERHSVHLLEDWTLQRRW